MEFDLSCWIYFKRSFVPAFALGSIKFHRAEQKVAMMPTAQSNKKDLATLKALVESGKVKPVIDKRYPLKDTAEAVRHLETGHARRKVVITI